MKKKVIMITCISLLTLCLTACGSKTITLDNMNTDNTIENNVSDVNTDETSTNEVINMTPEEETIEREEVLSQCLEYTEDIIHIDDKDVTFDHFERHLLENGWIQAEEVSTTIYTKDDVKIRMLPTSVAFILSEPVETNIKINNLQLGVSTLDNVKELGYELEPFQGATDAFVTDNMTLGFTDNILTYVRIGRVE